MRSEILGSSTATRSATRPAKKVLILVIRPSATLPDGSEEKDRTSSTERSSCSNRPDTRSNSSRPTSDNCMPRLERTNSSRPTACSNRLTWRDMAACAKRNRSDARLSDLASATATKLFNCLMFIANRFAFCDSIVRTLPLLQLSRSA